MGINSDVLSNGMKIVHQEIKSQVAYLGIMINTGSRDELESEQGMAHFIEHTIFKGTTKRKAYHILSRLENVGGEINAYTTKEETAIYAGFLTQYFNRAAELFSDILSNSTYPTHELDREKEVIIEEINSYNDSPSELIYDDFEELIYSGHSMGRNILGTPEKIKKYDKSDILNFISRTYNSDQIVICSSGDIPYSKMLKTVTKYFSSIDFKPREFQREKFTTFKATDRSEDKDTYQAHCVIGTTAYNSFDSKRTGLVLLNNILGGSSLNSRLNMSLRERSGLAYNVESTYTQYSDTGIFNIYFGTDKEQLDRAIAIVHKELKKLRDVKLGSGQLNRAKQQLIGQIAMGQESREDYILSLAKSVMLYNRAPKVELSFSKIEGISASDILEIANDILDPDNLSTLIYR